MHHYSSCRLQGFPESFLLPSSDDSGTSAVYDKQHRQRVSQFYRQIGNAVSPPCVAAVAKKTVEKLFSVSGSPVNSSSPIEVKCPVQTLLLQSCMNPDKVMESIKRKSSLRGESARS